ncbi:MAG: bifunctional DNA-formamidopyrimidine glycosylase/DNA-(apurinic or apyrimidinic site) lyase [Kiritimatiellaceae bacterium]|nr:bifunctional DNA-formamidopyrimidine glycosylase/DNA-(apurinic or apyrimidinic site) lyase [Kiritimatiellaceae bacterium]
MPELPEVETIRRQLCAAGVEGRTIEKVYIEWPRTVEPLTPSAFCKQIQGRTLQKIDRHGKWLVFRLDGKENLLVHLRMTGGFYLTQGALKKGKHDRAILQLSGGLNLHFRDPRKFGRWRLVPGGFRSVETVSGGDGARLDRARRSPPSRIAGLGPDALTVTQKQFRKALENQNKVLKALLLDQSFVAGVGNIYADEALFEARLDPCRKSGTLSDAEKLALYKAVTKVIKAGVRNKGTSLGDGQGNYVDLNGEAGGHREKVKVYGRAGQPCVVCGQPLHKTQIVQRTTVFCPHCQK